MSLLLCLSHFGDEAVGFGDGALHVANKTVDIDFDTDDLAFEGIDGLGVKVVLQEEGLVAEFFENGIELGFGATHCDLKLVEAVFGGLVLHAGGGGEFGVGEHLDFLAPFFEKGFAGVFDGVVATADFFGAVIGFVVGLFNAAIHFLEFSAFVVGDGDEFIESGGKLVFGFDLGGFRFFNAIDEDVSFFEAQFVHRSIVGGGAGVDSKGQNSEEEGEGFHYPEVLNQEAGPE